MWSQHLFLDLLDLKADFLTVRRVEHKTLQTGPGLERGRLPLFGHWSESIYEATEHNTAFYFIFLRLSHHGDLVKGANADLSEDSIDLF